MRDILQCLAKDGIQIGGRPAQVHLPLRDPRAIHQVVDQSRHDLELAGEDAPRQLGGNSCATIARHSSLP
jgi:hypothetical protein